MARTADRRRRNTGRRNTGRRSTAPRLSQRGSGVVALAVAGTVALALSGHAGAALLAGGLLYALVTGRVAVPRRRTRDPQRPLRALAWTVAALAAVMATQGTTAAGGATLGMALAAALATYLKLTTRRSR